MHIRIRRIRNRRRWRRLFDLQRLRRDERGIQLVEAAIVVRSSWSCLPRLLSLTVLLRVYDVGKGGRGGARYLSTSEVGTVGDTAAKNRRIRQPSRHWITLAT